MSLPPSTSKKSYTPNLNKIEGAKKGKLYEIISLLTLAKKGYELSIAGNTQFRNFCIGREVGIGKYRKFDDVVLSYVDEENVDQENRKNLIFLQLKHCQYSNLIDSSILSTEADTAKDVASKAKASATGLGDVQYGYMCKYFNLQQYFISFLSARDELENTNTEELKDGKIKYVVIFTNSKLDNKELEGKGFSFKEAPGDIVGLLTLSSETERHCHQLGGVSEDLRKILEKSSDLDRLARELARYVVCEDYRVNRVMGTQETPIKYYHVALEKEVIQKSTLKQVEKGQHFCEAQFREEFLNCNETATNLYPLRKALFEAIREIDESKEGVKDDDLKKDLKAAKWKIVYNFEKNKQNIKTDFSSEWIPVKDDDIKDFLQCFVFMVNQPGVKELELLYNQSIQSVVVENSPMKQFLDQINATGPEFSDCVERVFGLELKPHNDEKWIPPNQFEDFREKKQRLLRTIFVVGAMTLMYKNEIMQYGEFNDFGKIIENVKNFLTSGCKILCINTPVTLLSSIKMSQALNEEVKYPISLSLNILNSIENRDCVLKAFELESTSLLTIQCRHAFKDQDVKFLDELVNITKNKSNKKIILIMQQENCERFKINFKDEEIYVVENDSIELKDFEPKEDPLAKKVLVFQGQKERVSLSDITGIDSWPSYVHTLSQGTNEQGVIDEMALEEILINEKIKVGSKPAGTSSLEGAYAQMYEEINVENLVVRLTSQEHGNDTNDIYIISGITEFSKQGKTDKVIQYLGLNNNKEIIQNQFGDIGSEGKIQVADDKFKDKHFQGLCHRYPEKRIFWICVKCEDFCCENKIVKIKFILQEIYNPKFYLKRKFQNVIIKEDLKELLFQDDLSETFIFCCVEDREHLYKSMGLNEHEIEQFEDNCKIRVFFQKSDAETCFRQLSEQNETVHLLEFEKQQFFWCESQLIGKIKERKVVMFADDPGMGKTTTLIKLYETEFKSSSIIKSHWVIRIKLRDHLGAVLDLQFENNSIDTLDVIEFLSNIDSKLNNNLAKNLLKFVLDKSKSFQVKPLLLIFDGFDEVLDEDYRKRILLLLQFIKDKTAAKLWITTRCHFKNLLEETLSTIAIQFSPMDDAENAQYIATYLQHRLYLTLNNKKYTELFDTDDKKQKLHMYTAAFINKMKSIFRGDISTFIGTPLQLYLMLEITVKDFKNSIEGGDDQICVFKHVRNDVWDIYEYFIERKYDVYFLKIDNLERDRQRVEKFYIEEYHKDFAQSKILKESPNKSPEEIKNTYLLAGVIKSQGADLEFIHKTFEEFFAAKVFIDWIKIVPDTKKQEYLLTEILMKPDYQLVRTFMNLQLQKLSEQARKDERPNEVDKSQEHYGTIAAKLLNQEKSPLIDVNGTPLHIAVKENNKHIAWFLLNSLKGHSEALRKFLFAAGEYRSKNTRSKGTALHLACRIDDVEMVKLLLDAAEGISEDTLQEFLKCLDEYKYTALVEAARNSHNVQLFNELLSRANNKLDLILTGHSALCSLCFEENEEFVDFLLQQFEHDKHSLKKLLLLYNRAFSNALSNAKCINVVEKLTSAAKSIEDNNETLKNLLLPKEGDLLLIQAVYCCEIDIVVKLLSVAKEIDDHNHTLKQLLLDERYKSTPLHAAAEKGRGDIIKLLLETAADLGIENLNELITAVDEEGRNAIQLMIERGYERIFYDSFKMLKDEYPIIWEKVMEMFDNVPLESRLCQVKEELLWAIVDGNIKEVKHILSNAKHSSDSPNESLKILLLAEVIGSNTLRIACEKGNSKIIKELLFYAVHMEDEGETLTKLLIETCPLWPSPFQALKHGYTRKIKKIVESLIFEARIFSREHAVNILEHINNQYTGVTFPSEESDDISVESEDTSEDSEDTSEESDDISEESNDISEESDDTSEELGDILEESDDTSEESDDILRRIK